MMKQYQKSLTRTAKFLTISRAQGTISTTPDITVKEDAKTFNSIPGPLSLPVFGSLPYLIKNSAKFPLKFQRKIQRDYGDIAKINLPSFGDFVLLFGKQIY